MQGSPSTKTYVVQIGISAEVEKPCRHYERERLSLTPQICFPLDVVPSVQPHGLALLPNREEGVFLRLARCAENLGMQRPALSSCLSSRGCAAHKLLLCSSTTQALQPRPQEVPPSLNLSRCVSLILRFSTREPIVSPHLRQV